jgi:hypothetical protein
MGKLRVKVSFTIEDTEYLLRKLMQVQIEGREVETASRVLKKVKELHQQILDMGIVANVEGATMVDQIAIKS